jgi:hypothetical protein
MRQLTTLLLLTITIYSYGQRIDSLGVDNNRLLNKHESFVLNKMFKKDKKAFDFTNKSIGFIGGTTGTSLWTKKEYFDNYVKPIIGTKKKTNCSLIFLTNDEKTKSGGCDALVLTPVKVFTDNHKEKVIAQLGSQK